MNAAAILNRQNQREYPLLHHTTTGSGINSEPVFFILRGDFSIFLDNPINIIDLYKEHNRTFQTEMV
jgi:hypothetical protein